MTFFIDISVFVNHFEALFLFCLHKLAPCFWKISNKIGFLSITTTTINQLAITEAAAASMAVKARAAIIATSPAGA